MVQAVPGPELLAPSELHFHSPPSLTWFPGFTRRRAASAQR